MAEKPIYLLDTFAERRAAREKGDAEPTAKAVDAETDEVEDKAVAPKKATRKTPKKS